MIRELITFDKERNDPPLFTDPEEFRHTEPYTNALSFYSNHLISINTRRFRESKEYELPTMQTVADIERLEELRLGKLQKGVRLKSENKLSLQHAPTVIKTLHSLILGNSWVKQPDLALGAVLGFMSTLISRKVVFQGMSPNLYVLNISPSGSGKDAPQQMVKNFLIDINADRLLGSGDYVSDASLMDGLGVNPVRLDIMDEAGGILKNVSSSKADYSGKMSDILAELWSAANNKYMGRNTAEGNKGSCYRPNVNILASTTPVGFSEGVNIKAIEKGLLGRFIIFMGNPHQRAERLRSFPKMDIGTKNHLRYWLNYEAQTVQANIGMVPQFYDELKVSEEGENRLDEIFKEFDDLRCDTKATSPLLPIIARLYQQLIKITMISACARNAYDIPEICKDDIDFAYDVVQYYYKNIQEIINRYIFNNNVERESMKILNLIRDRGGEITKTDLARSTRSINKRQRDGIIEDLLESEQLFSDSRNINDRNQTVFILGEEV